MRVEENLIKPSSEIVLYNTQLSTLANLVFYFGDRTALEGDSVFNALQKTYPNAIIAGCSTGGEIHQDEVYDGTITTAAVSFEQTPIKATSAPIHTVEESFEVGKTIGLNLNADDLKAIFVLSDGLNVDGSELSKGISSIISENIPITGGLAGDGTQFSKTLVGLNVPPSEKNVVAIGFYGDSIQIGHGSMGGWDVFGPKRLITKSKGTILYEIDGKPALEVYKSYLGPLANKLPASALTFPVSIHPENAPQSAVVRTILAVNEKDQSMTFAGTIPEGYTIQLLRGTLRHLVEGSQTAAKKALCGVDNTSDSLALLISCIGRKLLLKQRTVDEIEAIGALYNDKPCTRIGFYSYGELSPQEGTKTCELHNQTMTITTLYEA